MGYWWCTSPPPSQRPGALQRCSWVEAESMCGFMSSWSLGFTLLVKNYLFLGVPWWPSD